MEDVMKERLQEIVCAPEKIMSDGIFNGREESDFDSEKFRVLYEAILHLVKNVRLLDLWNPSFCILHPDLTPKNILVSYEDPTCVVGIVDWEGARIQPWVDS
jgi:Ser/Thr protein kinase RdoA (MazF antagonist)